MGRSLSCLVGKRYKRQEKSESEWHVYVIRTHIVEIELALLQLYLIHFLSSCSICFVSSQKSCKIITANTKTQNARRNILFYILISIYRYQCFNFFFNFWNFKTQWNALLNINHKIHLNTYGAIIKKWVVYSVINACTNINVW